ncbi:hypothetical protein AG0111_0g3853 [Alternaria gaisen]|uniref:Uncharacterized protein n=1 Tax=Alternaria gaisen TaxID=167740 RepID=A0ACB6FUR2_9PLEO|nr:hypothetical protein AG0111_0g3853 [Alternaria gaisen]
MPRLGIHRISSCFLAPLGKDRQPTSPQLNSKPDIHMFDIFRDLHFELPMITESSPEDIEDAFLSSIAFIIMATIFLQFLIVDLAIEIAYQIVQRLENTEIDCELGEIDVVRRNQVDTWPPVTAKGEPCLDTYVVDSTPPPPYKMSSPPPPYKNFDGLDVVIVELEDGDNR